MRNACSRGPAEDMSPANRSFLVPQIDGSAAVEDDEDLLIGRVAVRRVTLLSRLERDLAQARAFGHRPKIAIVDVRGVVALRFRDVEDVRGPLSGGARLGLPGRGLPLPWVSAVRGRVEPGRIHANRSRSGQESPCVIGAHSKGEQVQPLAARFVGVGLLRGEIDEAVAGSDLVRGPVHPGEPRTGEDVEDLLLDELRVSRRRPFARVDFEACHAHAHGAGRRPEIARRHREMACLAPVPFELVPVHQVLHGAYDNLRERAESRRGAH